MQSLIPFVQSYGRHGREIAVRSRRGYRMESWSYARIFGEANRVARELESQGVCSGDTVLLWGQSSPEWIAAFFGCVLRGTVVVPIDSASTMEFVAQVNREVSTKMIFRSTEAAMPAQIPSISLEALTQVVSRHSDQSYPSPELTRDAQLEIIFTSGTTGAPRGVVITHGNVLANIEPIEREAQKYLRYERLVHPIRLVNSLPLSHIFGQILAMFVPPLLRSTVIFANTLKPSELANTIHSERASVLIAVPRVIESLQREIYNEITRKGKYERFQKIFAEAEGKHFLKRWWTFREVHARLGWKFWAFVSGGATLPENVEKFWNRLGYPVIQGYGMTETTSLITLNHPFRSAKGSIGRVFPGMEVRIDEHGEVLVRGKNVAAAYHQGQQLQPTQEPDGWFRTGDVAEMASDGCLYFRGRKKNVIVTSAGMNIYPEDLERALRDVPGVRDCVVVGIEKEGNAEPCAVLLLDGRTDAATVVETANASLAEYQRMHQWLEWPEPDFPRTSTHKPLLATIQKEVNAKVRNRPSVVDAVSEFIARLSGKSADVAAGDASLDADLGLTSLDRVELMGALEDRYQLDLSGTAFSEAATVEEISKLVANPTQDQPARVSRAAYPRWPQGYAATALRLVVYYLLAWPATYLLAAPRVEGRKNLLGVKGPVLMISNHVTYMDIAWILAALPGRFRNRLAAAMQGELLMAMRHPPHEDHFLRRMQRKIGYFLAVILFNAFPLPRQTGFLQSFSFIGDLADQSWNVLIFPEGKTTEDGKINPFRGGIGLLAKNLGVPVVPIRIDGLFELKQRKNFAAKPGHVRVSIGPPVHFSPETDPDEITKELQRRVLQA